MGATTKTLYDTDFAVWSSHTAELLRAGRVGEVDLEHVAEEIEDLGKSERSAVASLLFQIILHQATRKIQPERDGASWRHSIVTSQFNIERKLEDSPSLTRFLADNLESVYLRAARGARRETGIREAALPLRCPFTLDQLLEEFDLEWPPV
jgi:Domain of unknown function DUF29